MVRPLTNIVSPTQDLAFSELKIYYNEKLYVCKQKRYW